MAIKAGTFIHDIQGTVIDRIQTGGVSSMNIPQTRIYELGNYQTVGTIFDIPDLSFDINSVDVSCDLEALVSGVDPTTVVNGQEFNFNTTYPIDVISPFKAGNGQFNIVKGIIVPALNLDTVAYKFGVKANAEETFTLKSDSVYYTPGSPYYQQFNLVAATLTYNISHTATPYIELGNTIYVLSACVKNLSTGAYQRLFYGSSGATSYTNTSTSITTATDWQAAGYTTLHVTYGSTTAATYPQARNSPVSNTKPAAIRSKDLTLYIGPAGVATSTLVKISGVQSFDISRKVNLQNTEEFGNTHYASIDYDTVDVTGTITLRPTDAAYLLTVIEQITGTDNTHISGPISNPTLEIELQVRNDAGTVLKTFNIADARFTVPAVNGKPQTLLDISLPFTSDAGLLSVFKGSIS